jgi:hypothetical protein
VDNPSSIAHSYDLAPLYRQNSSRRPSLDLDESLFGHKQISLQKILANANKEIEKSTKFMNKIKSKQLACSNIAKSIPENATVGKEYINCGKEICEHKQGPYYYAYWKDPLCKKLKKKYTCLKIRIDVFRLI